MSLNKNNGGQQSDDMFSKAPSFKSTNASSVADKENSQPAMNMKETPVSVFPKKSPQISGTTAPSVGSAIDMMNIAASTIAPIAYAPTLVKQETNVPTGQQVVQAQSKQRTVSTSVAMSTPVVRFLFDNIISFY